MINLTGKTPVVKRERTERPLTYKEKQKLQAPRVNGHRSSRTSDLEAWLDVELSQAETDDQSIQTLKEA